MVRGAQNRMVDVAANFHSRHSRNFGGLEYFKCASYCGTGKMKGVLDSSTKPRRPLKVVLIYDPNIFQGSKGTSLSWCCLPR